MIRVFLADDHAVVREGLKRLLSAHEDLSVVGEASSGEGLAEAVAASGAEVLVLDASMPGPGPVRTLEALQREAPATRTLVLSFHAEDAFAVGLLRAGASGYLSKDRTGAELVEALRAVHRGEGYLTPATVEALGRELRREGGDPGTTLSPREREAVTLTGRGLAPAEVAAEMGVSASAAATFLARAREKLGVPSNTDLVRYALEHGLA